MPFTITRKGLISLWRDGVRLSQHTDEPKAYEAAYAHAEANGDGAYRITYPEREVQIIVKRRTDGPSVPELGTPTSPAFDSVVLPLTRPSTGPAAIASYEIDRSLNGTTWTTVASGPLIFGNPPTQYVDGGRLPLTTYYYRARATDTSGRISAYSSTVSVTTVAQPGGTMTWNPGYGVRTNQQPYDENRSLLLSEYTDISNDVGSRIKFIATQFAWGDLERTKGDYSNGFAMIDAHIARCASLGYKLGIQLKTRKFGGTTVPSTPQANQRATPDYLISEGQVFICTDGGGEGAALHRSYVMDRVLLLIQALGNRYGTNPNVEFFEFGELSYNMSADTAQWSETNYIAQVNRLCDALPIYWPRKARYPGINYVWGQTQTQTFAIRSMNAGNGMSAPDCITNEADGPTTWPRANSWGGYVYRGYSWVPNAQRFSAQTLPDRYLELPSKQEMQVIPNSTVTPAIYADFAADYLKCTHFIVTKYDPGTSFRPNTGCEWAAWRTYLNGSPRAMNTSFPTRYTADGLTPVTG